MKQQIWTETYKVTSFLINLRAKAGLYSVLSFIQDVGWQHASHLRVKLPEHHGWVFTRQKLTMREWPQLGHDVSVRTWLKPPSSQGFLFREYEISVNERVIGKCTSAFAVMDMQTRKMVLADWALYTDVWRQDSGLSISPAKISACSSPVNLAEFQVRNSDIDSNNHVNNTKYAQWILDSLPINILREGLELQEYEINFLAEARIEDVITIQRAGKQQTDGKITIAKFQGLRKKDDRVIFTAQLKTT